VVVRINFLATTFILQEDKTLSLINVSNLTFSYPGSFDNIFEDVSFQIDTNWKLGFTGRNGRGKTTFLNLLLGKYEYSGRISTSVDFEYFPFEVSDKTANTIDVISLICFDYQDWELSRELNLLQVSDDVLYRPFDTLSNGEQTKVMLAALFLKEDSFLLIDEPTNHLDILGRKTVSSYLKNKSGFILVSHDRYFLDECVDHVLSINKCNIEIERGNFSSWFINKERRDSFELAENEKLKKEVKRLQKTAKEKAEWSAKAERRKKGYYPIKD
jgi:lincosamide and streptogramin A transport system ATP-binding/permease protein